MQPKNSFLLVIFFNVGHFYFHKKGQIMLEIMLLLLGHLLIESQFLPKWLFLIIFDGSKSHIKTAVENKLEKQPTGMYIWIGF